MAVAFSSVTHEKLGRSPAPADSVTVTNLQVLLRVISGLGEGEWRSSHSGDHTGQWGRSLVPLTRKAQEAQRQRKKGRLRMCRQQSSG